MEEYNAVEGALVLMDKVQGHDIKALTDWLEYGVEIIDHKVNVSKVAAQIEGGSMSKQTYKNNSTGAANLIRKFKSVEAAEAAVTGHNAQAKKASFNPSVLAVKLGATTKAVKSVKELKAAARGAAAKHAAAILNSDELTKAEKRRVLEGALSQLS